MKRFHQRSLTPDKGGPQTVSEPDSDFEEITAAEKPAVCNAELILLLLTVNNKTYTPALKTHKPECFHYLENESPWINIWNNEK